MSVFGGFFDPTDANDSGGILDSIGNVATAPARWVGDSLGALIGGVGGGAVNAISTPLLLLFGMILAAVVLMEVL